MKRTGADLPWGDSNDFVPAAGLDSRRADGGWPCLLNLARIPLIAVRPDERQSGCGSLGLILLYGTKTRPEGLGLALFARFDTFSDASKTGGAAEFRLATA